MVPYHGWMWWHHVAGLTGGLALLAWIFSGWLSVDPFRLFASDGIGTAERMAYADAGQPSPVPFEKLAEIAPDARQGTLSWAAGQQVWIIERPGRPARALDPVTLTPTVADQARIVGAAGRLVPGAQIVRVDRLTAPDAYWYDVGALPKLPVLRLHFDDPARTWVHIDPATGILAGDIDVRRRLYRWLFDLLHKWDLNGLTLNRPAWDIVLWLLSILGIVLSVSGVRIGWSRLTRP